jgi:hypothetical protein
MRVNEERGGYGVGFSVARTSRVDYVGISEIDLWLFFN